MRKILCILALIAITFVNAQTILPLVSDELCPNQEYTFTASLPGGYNGINASGGATITQYPSGSGTSITFKGTFSDITGSGQIFEVSYQGGSKPFKFTRIKSLFGGYKEGSAPSQIVAPICVTTPFALNITGDQYWDASTNPYSSFGSINNYRFLIPSGWYLNSTLSNGSTWITASGSVTLTPTASTGNDSTIQYAAKNSCSGAFFEGTPRYISISRPNPTFTLSPTSLTFVCGTPQTKTFTVSTPNTISCSTSYTWNLGANNGWLYNGSSAPASFSTSTSSITLTSASGNILPSTVNVIPVLNDSSYAPMSCSTSFSSFTSTTTINGNNVICLGGDSVYTMNGLGAGNNVTWSSSNTAVATVSNGTQSQVVVNGLSQGTIDLIANITNSCGQQKPIIKSIRIGDPSPPSDILGFCCNGMEFGSESIYEFTVNDSNNQGVNQFDWVVAGGTMLEGQGTNTIFVKTSKVEGTQILYFDVSVRVGNNCGLSSYLWRSGYVTSGVGPAMFTIYPNPSTETVNLELRDKNDQSVKDSEISGELFDFLGYSKGKIKINDFKAIINVSGLTKGIYVLKINIDGHNESHQIIVQ